MILLYFFRLIIVHQLIVGASGYDYAWLAGMLIIHLLVLVPGRQATTDLVVRMTARAMLAMLGNMMREPYPSRRASYHSGAGTGLV